ncbi:MAG: hypothetical protein JWL77_1417 [Chthonomonadaceae bacterium]|nr:hypothetical protein [Chthonomonadaceae bacterium]
MSTDKSKRLVGWTQYLETQCSKLMGNSVGVVFEYVGYIFVMGAIGTLVSSFHGGLFGFLVGLIVGTSLGGIGVLALWVSMVAVCEAEKIVPVALITKQNAKHLPEAETLIRGSDRPSTDQEAELLRAVLQGQETPPEQLLRAAQESRQDA